MKIEVDLNKRFVITIVFISLITVGLVGVIAYKYTPDWANYKPDSVGHSVDEINWDQTINRTIRADDFCVGTKCLAAFSGGGGGGQWNNGTSGVIYYNVANGKVGIGTSTPNAKLEVVGGSINASGGLIIPTTAPSGTPAVGQMWLIT